MHLTLVVLALSAAVVVGTGYGDYESCNDYKDSSLFRFDDSTKVEDCHRRPYKRRYVYVEIYKDYYVSRRSGKTCTVTRYDDENCGRTAPSTERYTYIPRRYTSTHTHGHTHTPSHGHTHTHSHGHGHHGHGHSHGNQHSHNGIYIPSYQYFNYPPRAPPAPRTPAPIIRYIERPRIPTPSRPRQLPRIFHGCRGGGGSSSSSSGGGCGGNSSS